MRNVIALSALLCCATAVAEPEHGFYVGASVGGATLTLEDADSSADFEGSDTAYKIIAGYRIIDWVGVEANYANYGKPHDDIFGLGFEGEFESLSIAALGMLPLGPVDIFGKLGVAGWSGTFRSTDFRDIKDTEDNVDPLFGVGVQYRTGKLAIRSEVEALLLGFDDDDDDERDGDDWIYAYTLGVTWTF